jgi:hypothetical protein
MRAKGNNFHTFMELVAKDEKRAQQFVQSLSKSQRLYVAQCVRRLILITEGIRAGRIRKIDLPNGMAILEEVGK